MKKKISMGILLLALLAAWPIKSAAQKPVYPYSHAFQVSLNNSTQFPCGFNGTPTQQLKTALATLAAGTLDLTCYTAPITITEDVFSSISKNITIILPPVAVSVAANATIPSNFQICARSGSSLAAALGYTLTNNGTSCATGSSGGSVGCAQLPALTGAVTSSPGSCANALNPNLPVAGTSNTGAAVAATYTGSGTGGATRTATSKLADSLNVLDYGCDITGATYCTTALQNAFNAMVASTHVLNLPAGTLKVTNLNFTGFDNWRIEGATDGTTKILCVSPTPNTGTCLDRSGDQHTVYHHLWIQGGTSAADAPYILDLSGKTTTSNGSWHTFDHVAVSTFGSYGLYNYGAESTDYDAMTWTKPGYTGSAHVADLVLSVANSYHVTSAFTTLATAPVSMTKINLGKANNSVTLAYGSWIIFDDNIFGATMGQITSHQGYVNSCSNHAAAITETSSAFSTNGLVIFGLDFDGLFQEHCDSGTEPVEYPFLSLPQSMVQYSKFNIATNTRKGAFPTSVLNAFDWGMSTFSVDTFGMIPPTIVACANTMEGYAGLQSMGNQVFGVGFGGQDLSMYCANSPGFTPVGAPTLRVGAPAYAGNSSPRQVQMGAGPGAGPSFIYDYYGLNLTWDGHNWVTTGDGANNGGAMFISRTDGTMGIISVPSTGPTGQTISDANILNYLVGNTSPTGETILNLTTVNLKGLGSWTASLPVYATNELALAAGLTTGMFYQTGADPSVIASVTGSAPVSGSAPLAPTGLNATAGNAQVVLSWNASLGATLYTPGWSTTSGGPYTFLSPSIAALTYTKTGLSNGTPYYFVVKAANSVGPSPNSVQVTATPTATPSIVYRPTTFADTGNYLTISPAQAYDGNIATWAQVVGLVYYGNWSGDGTWSGFANTSGPWTSASLVVYSSEIQNTTSPSTAVLRYSLNGGSTWTNLHSTTATWNNSVTPDTVVLGATQNLSLVKVEAIQPVPGAAYSEGLNVYEIYITAY